MHLIRTTTTMAFANSNDAYVPEYWAQESLAILESNMVVANLVHRDFSSEVASQGDVVNTRRPTEFKAGRKVDGDALHTQDAQSTNVPVRLDQHIVNSFMIYDKEASLSFMELKRLYLQPAILAMAGFIDNMVLAQVYSSMGTNVGQLGTAPTDDTLIDLKEALTNNKCPLGGRNLIISPNCEGSFLKHTDFVNAHTRGDEGSTMRTGHLGNLFGFDIFTCHNTPSVASGNTTHAAAINAGNLTATSTVITIDGTSETLIAGSWCTIAGDLRPQKITAVSGTPTTQLTISPGLGSAIVDGAVVTVYAPGQVNLTGSSYAQYWTKRMIVDGFTVSPKATQLMDFAAPAASPRYSCMVGIDATGSVPATTGIMVDRSLSAAVADDAYVFLGPVGTYNWAMSRNSTALVMRPLQAPDPGTGVKSFVASFNNLGLRVTIGYDISYQGHRVTLDVLAGIAQLDSNQTAVMYT